MDTNVAVTSTPITGSAHIRGLLRARDFAAVLVATEQVLATDATDRDALLFRAIAQRYLGHIDQALSTLSQLAEHHPQFSRLHEERGHCFVHQKRAAEAIASFTTAVTLNHALPASWSMLEGLYKMQHKNKDAAIANRQVAILHKLPPVIVIATGLFMDRDYDAAELMIRPYLLEHSQDTEAMRLLARIGMARKVFDDAEILLSAVLELAPDYHVARAEYAETLIDLQRHEQARAHLAQLMQVDPSNTQYFKQLDAAALVGLGRHDEAVASYQALIAERPNDADLHLSLAHTYKTLGRQEESIASYRQAAVVRLGFGDAYWSLANLKTYRFTDDELVALKTLQTNTTLSVIDRYHLLFALGKALEDRGDYAGSFEAYEQGNALQRAQSRYSADLIETNTRRQIEVCTREFFIKRHGQGVPDADPIFIIGLPRSGSTLIEQILASHSLVEGTQELPNIQQLVSNLRGRDPDPTNPRYPYILNDLSAEELRQYGEQYLAATRVQRQGKPHQVPFFIDKMPNNFRHLGLIRLILPNAKIIDARREPMACCFSNLKQLFAKGQEFTYSVSDIARYYRTYLELMRHWDQVLPHWILRVHHEDVVDDVGANVRRILDFCGLEFEPQCVEFHKTQRSVRTASSEQVRQPIYREGLDQWRHFEPWLDPLKQALGDALTRYRE
jgi:tetratricopeptide (TPR) repeat protein